MTVSNQGQPETGDLEPGEGSLNEREGWLLCHLEADGTHDRTEVAVDGDVVVAQLANVNCVLVVPEGSGGDLPERIASLKRAMHELEGELAN